MCTPVGHTLMGYTLYRGSPLFSGWTQWKWFLFILILANLPDIDVIFGWISGSPIQYHQGWTHSLFFVLIMSGITGFVGLRLKSPKWKQFVLLVFGILFVHLLLDYFGRDTRPPYGIPVFWPLSDQSYMSPLPIFRGVSKAAAKGEFLGSLFVWSNLWTVLVELLVIVPIFVVTSYLTRKKSVRLST